MVRRREVIKRTPQPDPKYGSVTVAKFVNAVMKNGKKSVAESIVYGAFDILKGKVTDQDPLSVFEAALENAKPLLHVKSRRVGGATYQVPVEIAPATRTAIAFRWIIEFSRKRGEKTMKERLAGELLDCYTKQGSTIKRKEDTHRMAEANKAFAHFRF
ncbi:MAG TPA: 30S ribosomal protein S7 [Candidatus Hydrogenedentes bacterium]|jgi:small subunit ribosomal protein S7|nr:30S ribosomal protein S7 [Candidatus Hydrogenedentota bacterium]HOD95585.1 30S ribosomal protein S7 [Candidatus Hydrogenedentota bacterium]HOR51064.1 30S ribosomal protein S7 [Candidatus Hydrogenedentota bacterium]HPK24947.1 30S ribosomal protein S7 [Candidatus Hydrogenedentota bacterium]HPX86513.1 30S ribosomal protein S7 [Candidatus Hydrogenedentota bacterium]